MSKQSLPPWIRGQLESEIDDFVNQPSAFLMMATDVDIPPEETALIGFTHGFLLAYVQSLYKFVEEDDPTQEELKEVSEIVRRRKHEIMSALREEMAEARNEYDEDTGGED